MSGKLLKLFPYENREVYVFKKNKIIITTNGPLTAYENAKEEIYIPWKYAGATYLGKIDPDNYQLCGKIRAIGRSGKNICYYVTPEIPITQN